MSSLHIELLETPRTLLDHASAWNDLWMRSEVTTPNERAEGLHRWLKYFAPKQAFQAVTVWEDTRMIAALPLVASRWAKVLRAGMLPNNAWLSAGTLLFDCQADHAALRMLADELNRLEWEIYRFFDIRSDTQSWMLFREALKHAGLLVECRPTHDVSIIHCNRSWPEYQATWSKNHRKGMNRAWKRLRSLGTAEMRREIPRTRAEAETALMSAFRIEDAGWKGLEWTSILRTPGMAEFLIDSSAQLLERGELEIIFLDLNGEAIAFEILWNCRGIVHSYKVGYDERFDKCEPGGSLMHELLRDLFESKRCRACDCIGPTSYATEKWPGSTYPISQWTAAPKKILSRVALRAYQRWWKPAARPLDVIESSDVVTFPSPTAQFTEV